MKILITGASRGIGSAVAKKFASIYKQDAIIAMMGRSLSKPYNAYTSGTLLETQKEVQAIGSTAILFQVDIKNNDWFIESINKAIHTMGGLDILIHNASCNMSSVQNMDLLYQVNTRATLSSLHACKKSLEESKGSIITISPPIHLGRLDWISKQPAYTISKYSMTLATLSAASKNVKANCLWPRYTIDSSTPNRVISKGRHPKHFANSVYALSISKLNAQTIYDDDVADIPTINAPLYNFSYEDTKHLRKN